MQIIIGMTKEILYPTIFVLVLSQIWYKPQKNQKISLESLSLNIGLNLFVILQLSLIMGMNHRSPRMLMVVLLIVGAGNLIFRPNFIVNILKSLSVIIPMGLLSAWGKIPWLITSLSRSNGKAIWATWNIDVISWSAIVNEFLISGYGPSDHLAGVNAYAYNHEAPSIPIFGSAIATWFNLESWEAASISLSAAFVISTLILAAFIQKIIPELSTTKCLLVAGTTMSTAFVNYNFNSLFFAQILSLGIFCLIIIHTISLIKDSNPRLSAYFYQITLIPLSAYVYPALLLPVCAVCSTLLVGVICLKPRKFHNLTYYVGCNIIGVLICYPQLQKAISQAKYFANVEAGWRLEPMNPYTWIFGSWYIQSDFKMPIYLNALQWVGFLMAVILLSRKVYKSQIILTPIIILFTNLVVVGAFLLYKSDTSSYQSWKFASYFTPIILAIIFAMIAISSVKSIWLLPIGLSIITIPLTYLNRASESTSYLSREMVHLSELDYLKSFKKLNMNASPYWENMMLSVMIDGAEINPIASDLWKNAPDYGIPTVMLRSEAEDLVTEPLVGPYVLYIPNK